MVTFFFMEAQEFKYRELTEKIIGCAMKVHSYFGAGFPEIVYKKALMIELGKIGLKFEEEKEVKIFYESRFIRKRRLDLLVEGLVLLELKAIRQPDNGDINQLLNYLKVFGMEVGLFFNFGAKSLYFKRYINTPNKSVKSVNSA